jgi:chromosome segregation ATPase
METLIAVSAATAFVALIAYLWNSDSNSKKNNRRLVSANEDLESTANATTPPLSQIPDNEADQILSLERTVISLKQQCADLVKQIEASKRERSVDGAKTVAAHTSTMLLSEKIDALETENRELRTQVAELENTLAEQQQTITHQIGELNKVAVAEEQLKNIRGENSDLLERLRALEIENEKQRRATHTLQTAAEQCVDLEAKAANLSEQNAQLLERLSQLQVSTKDRIAEQIEGLQELYHELVSQHEHG